MMSDLSPAQWFKTLADDTRCSLVLLIASQGELCVCELTCALEVSQPKISRHLAQLRAAGVLADRRQGQWVYYRLHPHLPTWLAETIAQLSEQASLTLEQQRLLHMGSDRPQRQTSCCPI
jgi:ArsR family transcriptional regulator